VQLVHNNKSLTLVETTDKPETVKLAQQKPLEKHYQSFHNPGSLGKLRSKDVLRQQSINL